MEKIQHQKLETLIRSVLLAEGCTESVAERVTEGLVSSSLRGVDSHGVRLIHHYLRALKAGRLNPKPNYQVEETSPTTAILDADHTFGHAAGIEATEIAARLAKENGSGHVAIRNSSHFGAAAYFSIALAKQNMIGLSFTHSDALIIPTRGKRNFLGNNPICFAAPMKGEEPFCFDMATSEITFNGVKQLRERDEVAPEGAGADKDGNPTTNPHDITMLFPVGGHKGYGLSLVVEILCSVLTGMNYGPHILKMFDGPIEEKRRLGHFVSALSIETFVPIDIFQDRIGALITELRGEPRINPEESVLVAGDPEKLNLDERIQGGIPMTKDELKAFEELDSQYNVSAL